jgi:hypothetical protein
MSQRLAFCRHFDVSTIVETWKYHVRVKFPSLCLRHEQVSLSVRDHEWLVFVIRDLISIFRQLSKHGSVT